MGKNVDEFGYPYDDFPPHDACWYPPDEEDDLDTIPPPDSFEVENLIRGECDDIKQMLLEKNRKYGNSALDPLRIFSKADSREQLLVRIDDKLSRIRNTDIDEDDEDSVRDLIGYLILLRIA